MKKHAQCALLFAALISVPGVYAMKNQEVEKIIKIEVTDKQCPCPYWSAIKSDPKRAALTAAMAVTAVTFWAVYDSDKSFFQNVWNFPSNVWIRLNNAIAGAQTKKRCY